MTDLLNQALILTVWGMGMTFAALGALVIGMYLITAWSKDKTDAHSENEELFEASAETDSPSSDQEYRAIENQVNVQNAEALHMAAAAGVAVALALTLESDVEKHDTPVPAAFPAAWDYYVRGRHLSQRSRFEQLRQRK